MRIRNEQIQAFEDIAARRFRSELADDLRDLNPAVCAVAGSEAVQNAVECFLARAEAHNFSLRGPLRLYVQTAAMFGCGFDTDPQLPWAASVLEPAPGEDEMLRADRLYREMTAYADHVFGPDNAHLDAALGLASNVKWIDLPFRDDPRGQIQRVLNHVFPSKLATLAPSVLERLIEQARAAAPDPGGTALVTALLLLFGHQALQDPLLPWMADTLGRSDLKKAEEKSALLMECLRKCAAGEGN